MESSGGSRAEKGRREKTMSLIIKLGIQYLNMWGEIIIDSRTIIFPIAFIFSDYFHEYSNLIHIIS